MANILIRADGGKEIGMGHIMRTLVLAKELKKNHNVSYICRNNKIYDIGINKINLEGFKVHEIKGNDIISEIIDIQNKVRADLIITDSYDVNESYFDRLKQIFKFSGYIDDINICRLNVDFILNQNINAMDMRYNTNPNNNVKLFLGPKYCLLRDEFRKNENRIIKDNVKDVLITVGGMDKDYNTLKIVNIIKKYNVNFHVVIGGAFEEQLVEKIVDIANEFSNIKLYKNAKMSELMSICDIAISASGSTIYELCAMKVPTIGFVVADNQKEICRTLNSMKVIIGDCDLLYNDLNELDNIFRKLIENKETRLELVKNQKLLVNTRGVESLAGKINMILNGKDDKFEFNQ